MLAAKGRAGGAATRAALLRPTEEAPTKTAAPTATVEPKPAPKPTPPAAESPVEPPAAADTIARLRDAKQRARDRETRDHG